MLMTPPTKRGGPASKHKEPSSGPSRATPAPTEKGYTQLAMMLPRFYVHVLDSEAEFLGQRRSQLLEMLVLRKLGKFTLERSPTAPKYAAPKPADLEDASERFVWHCRADLKKQFDDLRMQMGNVSPKTWITLALNEWIGRPSGVSDLGPGARK